MSKFYATLLEAAAGSQAERFFLKDLFKKKNLIYLKKNQSQKLNKSKKKETTSQSFRLGFMFKAVCVDLSNNSFTSDVRH